MSAEVRSISLHNLEDVVHVWNESSRGTSVEQELDPIRFLALAHHWHFAYDQSLLCYEGGNPVAIIVNCTAPGTKEAYAFYWGAVPSVRSSRVAIRLFEASCDKLRNDSYDTLSADTIPDRPVARYRFVKLEPTRTLLHMQTPSPLLPQPDSPYEIRRLEPSALSQVSLPPGEFFHWTQRPHFAEQSPGSVHIFGAFDHRGLQAYISARPQSESTTILDLRSPSLSISAGQALLRSLLAQFRVPFTASNVPENSYSHEVLSSAGFRTEKRYTSLYRNLRAA